MLSSLLLLLLSSSLLLLALLLYFIIDFYKDLALEKSLAGWGAREQPFGSAFALSFGT